jgi:hypothetical protein
MSHDEFFARFGHMCIDSSMRADYETVYQAFKSFGCRRRSCCGTLT